MTSKRWALSGTLTLVVAVLLGTTVWGSSSSSPRTDPLALNGRSPRGVELALSIATSGALRTTGTVRLDLVTGRASATVLVPVLTAATEIDLREVRNQLYLTSPNLADATGPVWYVQPVRWPSLRALGPILRRPSVALLSLLANARITRRGDATTYEMKRQNVSLGTFSPRARSRTLAGTLELDVTTGHLGEFTALWARLTSASATTTVSLRVLSYPSNVPIDAPPPARATTPAGPLLHQLVSSGALGSLILPTQLLQLLTSSKLG